LKPLNCPIIGYFPKFIPDHEGMNSSFTENLRQHDIEHKLIESIQLGNTDAFGKLYDKYAPVLHGVILKIVNDKKAAEGILQKSFMRFWMEINAFDPAKESLLIWMLTITRNVAFSTVPQKDKTGEIQSPGNSVNTPNPAITPIKTGTVFDSVPTEQCTAIDLVYFKGYSLTRAAHELNITVPALKTRLRMEIKNHGGIKSNG
jgi:RNA polymerase sigma-70 factor (ECF subfamily)